MNLSSAPQKYDQRDQAALRRELEQADQQNLKRAQDIELAQARFILTDTVTHTRYALTIANGAVSLVAQ